MVYWTHMPIILSQADTTPLPQPSSRLMLSKGLCVRLEKLELGMLWSPREKGTPML